MYQHAGGGAMDFDDDLPAFLASLAPAQFTAMKQAIQAVITDHKSEARVCMSTVHAYKGCETPHVRVATDTRADAALFYVACTRATRSLHLDMGGHSPLTPRVGNPPPRRPIGGVGMEVWGEGVGVCDNV